MNRENLLKWVVDLETTDEPQATGTLYNGEGYCCLGRLCRVMGLEFKPVEDFYYVEGGDTVEYEVKDDGSVSFAPDAEVRKFFDDTTFNQSRYSDLNDNYRLPFPEIAARIREDYDLGEPS